jgi:phenylalanyl-tRNA synthetase beta chain
MKVAVAMINAQLPSDLTITQSTIRGVDSFGMLCSARELGLTEEKESKGILDLPKDAPIGKDIREYLQLQDDILDISVTPNRGDCLSIRGLARELAASLQSALLPKKISTHPIKKATASKFPITLNTKNACPRYVGRIIRQVKADTASPIWLQERLRRSGIRSISPIVDVTNYVMLELGQPMHAFDLATIQQGIQVRYAKPGEKIALLDGSEKVLDNQTMVIADHQQPLAIAGVMGGLSSSVTLLTTDILLESAYFSPEVIARQRQAYQLSSESAYRFERGIDPTMQAEAIDYATQLIISITGGEAEEIIEVVEPNYLPQPPVIHLSHEQVTRLLGIKLSKQHIEQIFDRLKFVWMVLPHDEWEITPPPYRNDITIAEDVIEEIARLYGYNNIPTHHLQARLTLPAAEEMASDGHIKRLKQILTDLGYHEIISYSFVDKQLQTLFDPQIAPRELLNPISADMSVMRTNLWPGLINALIYNQSRQQQRIRLFEVGTCFISHEQNLQQPLKLAGMIAGPAYPEQWGLNARKVDFYDLKGNIEALLSLQGCEAISFIPATHPALHPGQTASICQKNNQIGCLGVLHPSILQSLDLTDPVFLFELDLSLLQYPQLVCTQDISKFPEIRRDLAILVKHTIPAQRIQDTIRETAGDWLKDVFIFDIYQGKGIAPDLKSVALALIWQHPTRTLVDEEITVLMDQILNILKGQVGAELRS